MRRYLLACLLGLFTIPLFAKPLSQDFSIDAHQNIDAKRWGILIYHSWMTSDNIGAVLTWQNVHLKYETLNSIDLAYQLAPKNPLRHFFQPLVSTVEVAGNFSQRRDPNGLICELDPYLNFRWKSFPWDNTITTTFSIGDGLSYVTGLSLREEHDSTNNNTKHLLNFLVLEASFAAPKHPDLQFVVESTTVVALGVHLEQVT